MCLVTYSHAEGRGKPQENGGIKAEASRWNKDHAEIEARKIKNVAGVAAHFRGLAEAQADRVRWTERRFGADHPEAVMLREMVAHFQAVADAVEKGER